MLKKFILLFFLAQCSTNGFSRSIDIQCDYDFLRNNSFEHFVKSEGAVNPDFYRKYEWWKFWDKRRIYFSIDLKTQGVTGELGGDGYYFPKETIADIFPGTILIKQKYEHFATLQKRGYSFHVYTVGLL